MIWSPMSLSGEPPSIYCSPGLIISLLFWALNFHSHQHVHGMSTQSTMPVPRQSDFVLFMVEKKLFTTSTCQRVNCVIC